MYTPENPHFNIKDGKLMKDIHPELVEIKKPIWEPYSIADMIRGKKGGNQGLVSSKKQGFKSMILNKIRANFFIPDPRKFWVRPSIKFLTDYIQKEKIEYIVSTGPPHSMHLIALGIKQAIPSIKWVVDIRDPWSRFDFLKSFGSSERSLNKQADLEGSVLNACDRVIATSMQMKDLLVDFDEEKFQCITNGYDGEDFKEYRNTNDDSSIILYHAGLLNKVRNPSMLWSALSKACENNSEIAAKLKIHLVGMVDEDVIKEISSYSALKDRLIKEDYKEHDQVIQDYSRSDVLLLLVNNTDNAKANIPGKLFEYLATDKSVLLISEDETDALKILKERGLYLHLNYGQEPVSFQEGLESFLLNSSKLQDNTSNTKSLFERKNLTSNLVNLLLEI